MSNVFQPKDWGAKGHTKGIGARRRMVFVPIRIGWNRPAQLLANLTGTSTSPIPKRPIMLQPIHRQISPLVGVLGRQLFVDVHPVTG